MHAQNLSKQGSGNTDVEYGSSGADLDNPNWEDVKDYQRHVSVKGLRDWNAGSPRNTI